MEKFRPNNLQELLSFNQSIRRDGFSPYLAFFRGQINDWPIKPNITRNPKLTDADILEKEKIFFENYNEETLGVKVLQHFDKEYTKYAQDWHNLFQAQHLGFYTRLTDWSQDFNTAMFFAIDDESETYLDIDGIIYLYKCPYYEDQLINFQREEDCRFFDQNPFDLEKSYMVKHYSQFPDDFENYAGEIRRFRQDGSFIILNSEDINKPIEKIPYISQYLTKIYISPTVKAEISNYLDEGFKEFIYFASTDDNKTEVERIRKITSESNNKIYWK
ncbi:FRG domain-containing protein [Chryseobacterium sp. WX]|uniref:FRG domain-containing protein n=1 Tax=Chryseobacterium sp. WX TaxID=3031803 RepID=UPI00240A495A|nr:FRG domain-containing protein [Chryseobacterium sp. WX]WFB69203.1 FRG domain-containing protein [Chryseobacterium sp. WX]